MKKAMIISSTLLISFVFVASLLMFAEDPGGDTVPVHNSAPAQQDRDADLPPGPNRSIRAEKLDIDRESSEDSNAKSADQVSEAIDEAIRRIRPERVRQFVRGGYTQLLLNGGDIGRVDPEEILQENPRSLANLLNQHSILTGAGYPLDLEITDVFEEENKAHLVKFRQVVGGIPLATGLNVDFDAEGNVTSIWTHILDPSIPAAVVQVFRDEAVHIAKTALANKFGRSDTIVTADTVDDQTEFRGATLEYRVEEVDGQLELRPSWKVFARTLYPGNEYAVRVDAHTANVLDLYSTRVHLDVRVCRDEGGAREESCTNKGAPLHTVRQVWVEGETPACVDSSLCNASEHQTPWNVANRYEDWVTDAWPGAAGNGTLDILVMLKFKASRRFPESFSRRSAHAWLRSRSGRWKSG